MLIKRHILDQILSGDVDRAYRRWKRPTVKAGGTLRSAVGELAINTLTEVDETSLTEEDAKRAGMTSLSALRSELAQRPDGTLYRIDLRYLQPDQRDGLRQDDQLSDAECDALLKQLDKLSNNAGHTHLMTRILDVISRSPGRRAQELADEIGLEKEPFKIQVRKLKNKGLTESLGTGYRISRRGARLLQFAGR